MINLHLLFGELSPKSSERLKLICFSHGNNGLDLPSLKLAYSEYHIPDIKNWSRDFSNLKANKETFVKSGKVFLTPSGKERLRTEYSKYIIVENKFEIGDFGNFNNLTDAEIESAQNMSQLYFQLHLLENSVRKYMEVVFQNKLGDDWWDAVANASNINKHKNRLEKEKENKWTPSRIDKGPLYSLDWIDLSKMMVRKEELFEEHFSDMNFFHRFSDLYGIRNVIAHNGDIDDEDTLLRIKLAIKDWIKQTG